MYFLYICLTLNEWRIIFKQRLAVILQWKTGNFNRAGVASSRQRRGLLQPLDFLRVRTPFFMSCSTSEMTISS